jgi:hypothetical protein
VLGGIALLAALAEASVEHVARADWQPFQSFGKTYLLLLPPWLIRAAIALVPFALARRLGGVKLLVHLPAAATCATAHFVLLAGFHRVVLGSLDPFATIFRDLFRTYFLWDVTIYAAVAGATHAFTYFVRMQVQTAREQELRAALAEARLSGLQGQLQPHFVFNVLNSVSMLARAGKTADVVNVVSDLSQLLRYTLRDSNRACVPLSDEVTFAERYVAIEQVRFADRFSVVWEIADEVRDAMVPVLLLQPLIENVVHHGVARVTRRVSVIVRARRIDDSVRVEVIDDGPGAVHRTSGGAAGDHIGLRNLRDRLRQLYGGKCELTTVSHSGFHVTVDLPYALETPVLSAVNA